MVLDVEEEHAERLQVRLQQDLRGQPPARARIVSRPFLTHSWNSSSKRTATSCIYSRSRRSCSRYIRGCPDYEENVKQLLLNCFAQFITIGSICFCVSAAIRARVSVQCIQEEAGGRKFSNHKGMMSCCYSMSQNIDPATYYKERDCETRESIKYPFTPFWERPS